MPYTITMKAPAGPPICTLLPPKRAIRKPAMMAVKMPVCGVSPLAMAKAMASGSATIPTVIPAVTSLTKRSRV